MGKWRFVVIPALALPLAYLFERTGWYRIGDEPVPAGEVDWSSLLITWAFACGVYFVGEANRSRRRKRRGAQE